MTFIAYLIALLKMVLFTDTSDMTLEQGIDQGLTLAAGYNRGIFNVSVVVYTAIGALLLLILVLVVLNKTIRLYARAVLEFLKEEGKKSQINIRSKLTFRRVSFFTCMTGCCTFLLIPFLLIPLEIMFLPAFAWMNYKLSFFLANSYMADGSITDPVKFWGTALILWIFSGA